MTLAYTRLYCRAYKAPAPSEEEAGLTRHVAWLLFSNGVLFIPVAFLSLSSLLPAVRPEAAKAVLLLVAPLPAAINPLLYLLFYPPARTALARRTCGGGGGASMNDEDAEKQSCDSTQALVGGVMKEDDGSTLM